MKNYRFIEDPGHGWIEVPVVELRELGITDKISTCSYQAGGELGLAYLEEDCDLSTWAVAKGFSLPAKADEWAQFWRDHVTVEHQEHTFVRSLPHYRPTA